MKLKLAAALLATGCWFMPRLVHAQLDSLAMRSSSSIDRSDLRKHLEVIASDEYEGRETGQAGQRKAAKYIMETFADFGVNAVPDSLDKDMLGGYLQEFEVQVEEPGGLTISIGNEQFIYLKDLINFDRSLSEDLNFGQLLFAGFGLANKEHDDMSGLQAKGRVLLVLDGQPVDKKGRSKVGLDGPEMQLMALKSENARAVGAKVLLIATDMIPKMRGQFGNYLRSTRMRLAGDVPNEPNDLQTILISNDLANALLENAGTTVARERKRLNKKGPRAKFVSRNFKIVVDPSPGRITSSNVLGYLPGTDKANELIIISAHYDHIGVIDGEVNNGADDDGSGTVALLEIAQAFANARDAGNGPRRSILFLAVSGEEKGLLGSEHYSEHPVFPLENTVADLNIDMIGRFDDVHKDSPPYIYVIGSDRLSTQLDSINTAVNERYTKLLLDMTFNAPDDPNRFYYRSDHYNFARKGIPVIFYFSGVHDDYHQPGDDVEKIRFDLLEQRTRLIFHVAWELANREERIVVDGKVE